MLRPLLSLGFRAGAIRHPAGEKSSPTFGAPGRGARLQVFVSYLFDTMIHIAEHQDEASKDFPLEEGAASATPQESDYPALSAATMRSARQHKCPSGLAPAGALSAARELLCHPPSSTASPGAVGQWRDDVDRLLGIAHIGSIRPRPQSSRHRYDASASVHSPSERDAPTQDLRAKLNRRRAAEGTQVNLERSEDLRDELNHRRAGKDARLSLREARECRRSPESHNLEQGPAAVVSPGSGDARFQASIPLTGVGCAALADHLCAVAWPAKFRPLLPEKIRRYDKPVRIPASLYHRHCSDRWKHRRDGDLLPCSSVWASPDLAHEPSPRIHILLGRALRAVHGELRQCLSAAWCRSTPPCSKGVRDEKMLEKLVTRDVDNVTTLFALTDKCARATEGRAWHSAPQAGVTQTAVPAPSPRTVSRRKRETRAAVARINGLLPRSSMPWLGAKVSATSAHGPRKAAATHARCTPTVATVSLTAGRLSS
jgi:hypothetical protein